MKGDKLKFHPPVIIGAICEDAREVPDELARAFAKLGDKVAFLPFEVERRHLGNTIACMKLMDIAGLIVLGRYQRHIGRYLPYVSPTAKRSGKVDVVKRKGKRFTGDNLFSGSFLPYLRKVFDIGQFGVK